MVRIFPFQIRIGRAALGVKTLTEIASLTEDAPDGFRIICRIHKRP